jgi:hypothetical protein
MWSRDDDRRLSGEDPAIDARLSRLIGPLRSPVESARYRFLVATGRPLPASAWPPPRSGPLRTLTRAEFVELRERSPYYRGRALYLATAAREADRLISRHRLRTALELGPHLRPLIRGADIMDRMAYPDVEGAARLILHDATVSPWPVADDAYDLFVALQVFEHLGSSQRAVFEEVRRVARHAVISLPIDWVTADPTNPHHQLSKERALSWFEPAVPTRIVEGNPGPRKRLIFVFEQLDRGRR